MNKHQERALLNILGKVRIQNNLLIVVTLLTVLACLWILCVAWDVNKLCKKENVFIQQGGWLDKEHGEYNLIFDKTMTQTPIGKFGLPDGVEIIGCGLTWQEKDGTILKKEEYVKLGGEWTIYRDPSNPNDLSTKDMYK